MTTNDALAAQVARLALAVEQLTLAYIDAHAPKDEPTDDGLPMGTEEPPLPTPPPGVPTTQPTAPAYTAVPGQFPPISGPVIDAAPRPQAQVVSPIPPQPQGLCPQHGQPWSRLVPAGIQKNTGRSYGAFWSCPVQGCRQKPPR